jgi:hypothetical protein
MWGGKALIVGVEDRPMDRTHVHDFVHHGGLREIGENRCVEGHLPGLEKRRELMMSHSQRGMAVLALVDHS